MVRVDIVFVEIVLHCIIYITFGGMSLLLPPYTPRAQDCKQSNKKNRDEEEKTELFDWTKQIPMVTFC